MLCPRWDSNRVPALANTGLPPKHTESGPVRHRYGPVRDPKCGHCPHPQFSPRQRPPPNCRTPHRQGAALLCREKHDPAGEDQPRLQPCPARARCRLPGTPYVGSRLCITMTPLHPLHGPIDRQPHDPAASLRTPLRVLCEVDLLGGTPATYPRNSAWHLSPEWPTSALHQLVVCGAGPLVFAESARRNGASDGATGLGRTP